ncbi:hypothetical protein CLU79DRAFT_750516 [Phycomyces nitens]|nr:hypothetical protein CLU79DRAFT_750511 [Phycomyces nitens]KAI9022751.1 hypothetical protein CLU79DRAFT_750516 [Phycomyces nitens]
MCSLILMPCHPYRLQKFVFDFVRTRRLYPLIVDVWYGIRLVLVVWVNVFVVVRNRSSLIVVRLYPYFRAFVRNS